MRASFLRKQEEGEANEGSAEAEGEEDLQDSGRAGDAAARRALHDAAHRCDDAGLLPGVARRPGEAVAIDVTVNNEADLRNAIDAANASAGPDTITIDGVITLTQPLPFLDPQGDPKVTIKGDNNMADGIKGDGNRMFFVRSGMLTLRDLTLRDGSPTAATAVAVVGARAPRSSATKAM